MNAAKILEKLQRLDTLDEVTAKFDTKRENGGLAWAIELHADDVFYARAMARIVRPLVQLYGTIPEGAWLEAVRAERDAAARRLFDGSWRNNSTSILQNAINQWEGLAMGEFVQQMDRRF